MLTVAGSLEKRQLKVTGLTLCPSYFQLDGQGFAALIEAPSGKALILEVHDDHPTDPWGVDLRRAPGARSLPKWHHAWGKDLKLTGFSTLVKLRVPLGSTLQLL